MTISAYDPLNMIEHWAQKARKAVDEGRWADLLTYAEALDNEVAALHNVATERSDPTSKG